MAPSLSLFSIVANFLMARLRNTVRNLSDIQTETLDCNCCMYLDPCFLFGMSRQSGRLTRVEAGSNTSTVTLRVVRGDEMGLKKAAP
jgi:hypothetical protein